MQGDKYWRFMRSYGSWNEIRLLVDPLEFLKLQALNRYNYSTGVPRVQIKWLLSNTNYFFAIPFFISSDTLYRYNDLLNRCARLTDDFLNFKDSQVVQLKSDLLAFRSQGPVITVTKFSKLSVNPATG